VATEEKERVRYYEKENMPLLPTLHWLHHKFKGAGMRVSLTDKEEGKIFGKLYFLPQYAALKKAKNWGWWSDSNGRACIASVRS
jgi:hypothetical protein